MPAYGLGVDDQNGFIQWRARGIGHTIGLLPDSLEWDVGVPLFL